MKKIILSVLLICLLAVPGSAWEITFEDHSSEGGSWGSDVSGSGFSLSSTSGNYFATATIPEDGTQTLTVNKSLNGCLAFTHKFYGASGSVYSVFYRRVNIKIYYDDMTSTTATVYQDSSKYNENHRIMIIMNGMGTGFDIYVDGTKTGSFSAAVTNIDKVDISTTWDVSGSGTLTQPISIDDISEDPYIIGVDENYEIGDTSIPFTYGRDAPVGYSSWVKLISPSGVVKGNITLSGSQGSDSFTISGFNESGDYSLRVYTLTDTPGLTLLCYSKKITYTIPSGKSLILDKDNYSPGDTMKIYTYMPTYSSGHKVTISYKTASGYTSYTYDVTSAEQTKNWVLPSTAQGGSFFAYFRDPSDNVVAYDSFEITAPLGTTSLSLDKSIYEKNDTIKISYKYLPEDSDITLILKSGSTNIFTESWRDLSGSGVISFNISGRAADSIYVKAVKPVAGGTNTVLKEATAKILSGNGFISGKVYDSSTNTPVSGATVYIGGSSAVTNALGYYEMTTIMGTQPVSITKDGYNQYTGNVQVYSLSTSQNFYLVKTISTGSNTLYGTVTDYYTGAPLNSTYIQIKNGSIVYSMLTHSKTGNYLFDQEGLSGSWDVTVTKTGYDTHTRTVTIEGDTYLSIKLVPVGGSSSVPDDDSSGSGSGPSGGGSSDDRPSREAAKDSLTWLESTMPNLIKLVVVVFVLALIGWRF